MFWDFRQSLFTPMMIAVISIKEFCDVSGLRYVLQCSFVIFHWLNVEFISDLYKMGESRLVRQAFDVQTDQASMQVVKSFYMCCAG